MEILGVPIPSKYEVVVLGGGRKGSSAFWCFLRSRWVFGVILLWEYSVTCPRSFFELTLDPISLWDMEEASSCQSGEWWHFWRRQCSCLVQLTTDKKREDVWGLFCCFFFVCLFWGGGLIFFFSWKALWQLTPVFNSRSLSSGCDSARNHL